MGGKGNYGFNAATGEYGDMVKLGIIDPTKVTRLALQNAASVAALILTTDRKASRLVVRELEVPAGKDFAELEFDGVTL